MAYQQNNGGNLTRIMDRAFPSMHLLQISMMKDGSVEGYKPATFAFLTLAPGEQNQGARTYNFQRKITLKYETREVAGLARTLLELGKGNMEVLPYTKFTASQGITKTVYIQPSQSKDGKPQFIFGVTCGNDKHAIPMEKHHCLGFGEDLMYLYNLAMKEEYEYQIKNPFIRPDNSGSNYNNDGPQNFSPPIGNNYHQGGYQQPMNQGAIGEEFKAVANGQGQGQYQKVNPFNQN